MLTRFLNRLADVTFGDLPDLAEAADRALGRLFPRLRRSRRPIPTTVRIGSPAITHSVWVAANLQEGIPMGTRRAWWRRGF